MRRFQYFQNQEISDVISQAEMSCNHTDDALLTDCALCSCKNLAQFAWMKLLTIHAVTWEGRPKSNVEKEELQRLFDIYHS